MNLSVTDGVYWQRFIDCGRYTSGFWPTWIRPMREWDISKIKTMTTVKLSIRKES